MPVLLALLGACVAREEPVFLERLAQLGVEHDERARDAEPHGAGLSGHAAAGHGRQHVELVGGLGHDERLLDLGAQRLGGERSSKARRLMVMVPLPGRRNTRAVDDLRRPVP